MPDGCYELGLACHEALRLAWRHIRRPLDGAETRLPCLQEQKAFRNGKCAPWGGVGGVGTNNKTVHIVLQANDGLGIQYPGPSLRVFVYYRLHCSTKSRASLFIAGEGRIAASVDVRGM